jgi:hypothetical protein
MNYSNHSHRLPARFFLPVVLTLAACGGGGGGGGSSGGSSSGSLDLHLTDAPADELLSFSLSVQALRLVDAAGAGENLLAGALSVELLGLAGSQRWLVRDDSITPGTYSAVRLEIDPASVIARDKSGDPVAVNVLASSFDAALAAPIAIGASDDLQVLIDFDLASSISGSANMPPLDFTPRGSASLQDTSSSTTIDEIRGVVQSVDAAAGLFRIDAFADDDLQVALGLVEVDVASGTLLLNDNGLPFVDSPAFFAALLPGATLVEVHGAVVNQKVAATRIEVEDQQGGTGAEDRVKIEGLVLNLDSGSMSFDLLLIEVEKGQSIVTPVLNALGSPAAIPVEWTASTLFLLDDSQIGSPDILTEGARVEVRFAVFATTPFTAIKIELEDGPEFEGRIVDVSGLPNSIVIHLDGDEPAIASGQVDSSTTPVTVQLGSSSLFLDTQVRPALVNSDLLVGLKVEAQHATLTGPSSGPTVTPGRLKVFPGRFRGLVDSVSPSIPAFNASMSDLKDPFGNNVAFGPVSVEIAAGCHFEDAASSAAAFFALFQNLGAGENLEVEVFGIGTGVANEIRAYEIEARVD